MREVVVVWWVVGKRAKVPGNKSIREKRNNKVVNKVNQVIPKSGI